MGKGGQESWLSLRDAQRVQRKEKKDSKRLAWLNHKLFHELRLRKELCKQRKPGCVARDG